MTRDALLKISAISLVIGVFVGLLGGVAVLLDESDYSGNTPAIYCAAFLPLIIIALLNSKRRKSLIILKKLKKSRIKKAKGEPNEMLELAKRFIDKDCIITLYDGTNACGIIKEVTDNGILIEEKGELIAVNLEFVAKIKEFPKNKNGKRKSIAY
jgi:hypothetical protein